jgi:hypothetical protein
VFGDPDSQRARLEEFAAGGITTFVLAPICEPDEVPGFIAGLRPRR